MFAKTHVPVLGLIENMSWYEPEAGQRHYPFGQSGGAEMARGLGLPLLAELPLLPTLREGGDHGVPAVLNVPIVRETFYALARKIALDLDAVQTKKPPEIIFE